MATMAYDEQTHEPTHVLENNAWAPLTPDRIARDVQTHQPTHVLSGNQWQPVETQAAMPQQPVAGSPESTAAFMAAGEHVPVSEVSEKAGGAILGGLRDVVMAPIDVAKTLYRAGKTIPQLDLAEPFRQTFAPRPEEIGKLTDVGEAAKATAGQMIPQTWDQVLRMAVGMGVGGFVGAKLPAIVRTTGETVRDVAKAAVRRAPGSQVAQQAMAAERLPGVAELRGPSPTPISELYGAAEKEAAESGARMPLAATGEQAKTLLETEAMATPGLQNPTIKRIAAGIRKDLYGPRPVLQDTGFVDASGEPIRQTMFQPGPGTMPVEKLAVNLKRINQRLGTASGEELGAYRSFLKSMHDDLRASPEPAAQMYSEAIKQAHLDSLGNELGKYIREQGIDVARKDALTSANVAKVENWIREHTEWQRQLSDLHGPDVLQSVKDQLADLRPLTTRALPPVRGAAYGSGARGGSVLLGTALGLPFGQPLTGAVALGLLPDISRHALMTGPGQQAVRWSLTPRTPSAAMPPSRPLGVAGAMLPALEGE